MELLLFLVMISLAFLIGGGCLCIIDRKRERDWRENAVTGAILLIGLAEFVHIYGAFLGHSLTICTRYYLVIIAISLLLTGLIFLCMKHGKKDQEKRDQEKANRTTETKSQQKVSVISGKKDSKKSVWSINKKKQMKEPLKESVYWLYTVLAFLIIIQLCITNAENQTGRYFTETDATPETVQSFLATDSIYQSNPLTGQAYESGMPSRLRILDLPTLYAMIVRASDVGMESLLYVVMPLLVITLFYLAYYQLAKRLFDDETEKALFMVVVAIVVTAGTYTLPLDGAQLLYDSHTGPAIRNCVLVPYTIASVLDGNWKKVLLCVACEACIVWTLYGCGVCLLIGLGFLMIRLFFQKKEAA